MLGETIEGHLVILRIDNPPANALSIALLDKLEEKLTAIKEMKQIKVVIIHGADKFFSAGADIKAFTSLQNKDDYVQLARKGQLIFDEIENFPVPIIAAIHGAALGGGFELALACHIRIATKTAKVGLPELNLGIIPGFGGTQRLPRLLGSAKAYEMILTGEAIVGEAALNCGLVNHLTEDDDLLLLAKEMAQKIANKSKPTILHVMNLIRYTEEHTQQSGLSAEANAFAAVFGNRDAKEGIEAFIEKRRPHFNDN